MPIGEDNSMIPGCGCHHIAIQTYDWESSLSLYRDVLGMEKVAEFDSDGRKVILLNMGDGSHVELFEPKSDLSNLNEEIGRGPIIHFAIATTDTRASIERVRLAGYEVTVEPKEVRLDSLDVTIAFFCGPNGETIEFFQTK